MRYLDVFSLTHERHCPNSTKDVEQVFVCQRPQRLNTSRLDNNNRFYFRVIIIIIFALKSTASLGICWVASFRLLEQSVVSWRLK